MPASPREALIELLADLGPLLIDVSRAVDRDPAGARDPLIRVSALIDDVLDRLPRA